MKKTKHNWAQIEEADKRKTAAHEAGHYIVAQHFKLHSQCLIMKVGSPSITNSAYAGKTYYQLTTPLRASAIGWGGLIAQEFHNRELAHEPIPSEPEYNFYDAAQIMAEMDASPTDQEQIAGNTWRAFKIAWQVLIKNQEQLKFVAEKLASEPAVDLTKLTAKKGATSVSGFSFSSHRPSQPPARSRINKTPAPRRSAPAHLPRSTRWSRPT